MVTVARIKKHLNFIPFLFQDLTIYDCLKIFGFTGFLVLQSKIFKHTRMLVGCLDV